MKTLMEEPVPTTLVMIEFIKEEAEREKRAYNKGKR